MLSPNTASTSSPAASPTVVTVRALNLPLKDPQSQIGILFGNGPAALAISPTLPLGAAALKAATNNDTSVNITFPLPSSFSGLNVSVQITITSAKTGVVVDQSSVTTASLFNYQTPAITSIVVTRARFLTADSSSSSDVVACPFPPSVSAFWSCADSSLMLVSLKGTSFGACTTSNGLCLPAAQQADNVAKSVQFLKTNYTEQGGLLAFYGEVWCDLACQQVNQITSLPTPDLSQLVWIRSWTHTDVLLYARTSAAKLRMQLFSTGFDSKPITQQIQASFSMASPEVGALTGIDKNIPTTGGTLATTGVLQLSVYNLALGNNVNVTVGGSLAAVQCSCAGFTGSASAPAKR